MPAFGLDGPWRDRTGFAQTMEQASGLAWLTGTADGPPLVPRGPCDPIAGLHAAFATLVALTERDRTGRGSLVEATMVEAVLNVAAELIVEYTGHGAVLHRDGNRGPLAAPQGVYPCAGDDGWVALAVTDDTQWPALCALVGPAGLVADARLASAACRRARADGIDAAIRAWTTSREKTEAAAALVAAGIPAAPVTPAADLLDNPQLAARGFFEPLAHSVVGEHPMPGVAFRLASYDGQLLRRPAPTFGQHNDEVYGDVLGFSADDIDRWRERSLISDRPTGV
jgi:crotonobetainyl-CoA:carnitine CoA-transferase CaiB-like acyl-CoA transferase